jgi:hypothetical protein
MPSPAATPEQAPPEWSVEIGNARLARANNNPGNLRYAGQAGAEEGEGGFARFESPAAGMAALVRQVGLDRDRGDTVATFIRDYAPAGDGANDPEKYARDLAGMLGADLDTPLAELDPNEVAKGVARIESGTKAEFGGRDGSLMSESGPLMSVMPEQQAAADQAMAAGQPPGAMVEALPPQVAAQQLDPFAPPPGMSVGQMTVSGVDEDPAVTAQREAQLAAAYDRQQRAIAAAASERMAAEFEKSRLEQEDAAERARVAQERLAFQEAAQQATEREIDALVTRPLQQVDPGRYFRDMSVGRALALALGSFIGGASGTYNPVEAIDKAVEYDIKAQLEGIRLGEAQAKSRLAVHTRRLGSLEQGIAMTRAEIREAAGKHLRALTARQDAGTLASAAEQALADNDLKKVQEIGKVRDLRLNKKVASFVPTPRPTPVIPATPIGTVESPEVKRARVQQFQALEPKERQAILAPIQKGMAGVDLAERGLRRLMRTYGIVERGGQLVVKDGDKEVPLNQADIDSTAIGSGIMPWNWTVTQDAKTREQEEIAGWADLLKGARSEMPTEPPASFEEMVRSATKPESDSRIPAAIQNAWDVVREKKRLLESMSDPNAWEYLQWRNPPQGQVRPRTLKDSQ